MNKPLTQAAWHALAMDKECRPKCARSLPNWLADASVPPMSSNAPRTRPKPRAAKIREQVELITQAAARETAAGDAFKSLSGRDYRNAKTIDDMKDTTVAKKRRIDGLERDLHIANSQKEALEDRLRTCLQKERKMLDTIRERDERIVDLLKKQEESDAIIASLHERMYAATKEKVGDTCSPVPQHCPYSP